MFVKHYAPLSVTDVLYNWISQFKISCTKVWRRSSFSKLLLLTHLTQVTLTFDSVTPKSIGFLCCPGRMCGPSLRKVGQDVLKVLIVNRFGTFDTSDLYLWSSDPKIIRVPLPPRTVCGQSLRKVGKDVLELLMTDGPTCAKQYALSSSKGGHKNKILTWSAFLSTYTKNKTTVVN